MPNDFVSMPIDDRHTPKGGGKGQYFITCVKLPLGKSPKSFMEAINQADKNLPGGTRHSRFIHEEHSFVTLGRYDLVFIWRAPDLPTMGKYWQELLKACGPDMGSTETLVATHKGVP